MKKPYNFAEYNLIQDSNENNIIYRVVIILFIIGITVIICKFKFCIYEKNFLIKDNNSYLLLVDITKINELSATKKIIINKKEYDYSIKKIDKNFQNINGTIYETVYLDLNYRNSNNVINCLFLKKKATIIEMLIEFITGG